MAKIAISCRKGDSVETIERIFDRLIAYYGKDAIFRDIDDIPPGIDFRQHINETLLKTNILLAIVGPEWLGAGTEGLERINEESDPVRVEVETALRKRVPIIPVLIGNTKMPNANRLPPSLKDFVFRNAVKVDTGQDFDYHMDRLIRAIDMGLGQRASSAAPDRTTAASRPRQPSGTASGPAPSPPRRPTSALQIAAMMRRHQQLRPRTNVDGADERIAAFDRALNPGPGSPRPPFSFDEPDVVASAQAEFDRFEGLEHALRNESKAERRIQSPLREPAYPQAHVPMTPRGRPRRAHSLRLPALLLGAAASAAAAYVGRHELGNAMATLLKLLGLASGAAPPIPAAQKGEPVRELVDASAFAPICGRAGEQVLIQIFLHAAQDTAAAAGLAREADPDAARRGLTTLGMEVERDQRVDIVLDAAGLAIDEPSQSLIWRGEPRSCQFVVTLPPERADRTCQIKARILVGSVPVGALRFTLKVSATVATTPSDLVGESARRYQNAFLSHSHEDRVEVLTYAQLLQAAGINYFQDIASLRTMDDWEPRLHEAIDHCDLFLLFWTTNAARSDWVERETRYALERQKSSGQEMPDIMPIFLQPDAPRPPEWLKSRHFDSILRLAMRGAEAERRPH